MSTHMNLSSSPSLFSGMKLALVAGLCAASATCASQPTPPPVAAAPPSQAFQQASSGVAEPQGDDVVFVSQERKAPTAAHDDTTIPTSLHATTQTARPQQQ
jgi:hypothetical protein